MTDVASTKAAIDALAARPRPARSSAGTRWPGARRAASRRPMPACSAAGRGWSSRPPSTDEAAVARVEALALACGAVPVAHGGGGARSRSWRRSATCRSWLSAALVEAVAGARATPRPDWAAAAGLAAGGWDEHDAARARRRRRWARASRPRTPPRSPRACGTSATGHRRVARATSRGRTRTRSGTRLAAARAVPRGRRLRWASPGSACSSSRARSIVPGARLARRPPRRPRRRARRGRRASAAFMRSGAGRAGPDPQAGDPVPRAARRRALVPDAAHARGRRRAAPRPLVDRRRRSPQPGRRRRPGRARAASGPRSSSRTSCPTFAPVGLLNDDTTPVGAVHVGIVFVADAAGRPVAIRETDKLEGAFATTAEVAAVRRRHGDLEPARVRGAPRLTPSTGPVARPVPYSWWSDEHPGPLPRPQDRPLDRAAGRGRGGHGGHRSRGRRRRRRADGDRRRRQRHGRLPRRRDRAGGRSGRAGGGRQAQHARAAASTRPRRSPAPCSRRRSR